MGSSKLQIRLIFPFPEVKGMLFLRLLRYPMPVSSSTWRPWNDEDTTCDRGYAEAPLLPLQPRPTCERLELPFSSDDILSGYEDLVSSGSDHFTMWGKMSPREILS